MSSLSDLFELMREHGVVSLTWGDVTVVLGDKKPDTDVADGVDNGAKRLKAGKRGKDGLTASEQLEHYGRVIDAEE